MKRNSQWVALYLISATFVLTIASGANAQSSARRKRKKVASKVITAVKNSPPASNAVSHDIGVVVKATPFGQVVMLTNREKSPITIRKIIINDEWEIKDNPNLLHSTESWTSLPAELKLGDTLDVPVSQYRRAVIYVNLETNKGILTFKVN